MTNIQRLYQSVAWKTKYLDKLLWCGAGQIIAYADFKRGLWCPIMCLLCPFPVDAEALVAGDLRFQGNSIYYHCLYGVSFYEKIGVKEEVLSSFCTLKNYDDCNCSATSSQLIQATEDLMDMEETWMPVTKMKNIMFSHSIFCTQMKYLIYLTKSVYLPVKYFKNVFGSRVSKCSCFVLIKSTYKTCKLKTNLISFIFHTKNIGQLYYENRCRQTFPMKPSRAASKIIFYFILGCDVSPQNREDYKTTTKSENRSQPLNENLSF